MLVRSDASLRNTSNGCRPMAARIPSRSRNGSRNGTSEPLQDFYLILSQHRWLLDRLVRKLPLWDLVDVRQMRRRRDTVERPAFSAYCGGTSRATGGRSRDGWRRADGEGRAVSAAATGRTLRSSRFIVASYALPAQRHQHA
jgi:hypothetical protein